MDVIHTIGRRKTSVARIFVSEGKGEITVNKKKYNDYFPTSTLQYKVVQPLALTDTEGNYDIKVTVVGGGSNASRSCSPSCFTCFVSNQRKTSSCAQTRRFGHVTHAWLNGKNSVKRKPERNSNSQNDNLFLLLFLKKGVCSLTLITRCPIGLASK